MANAMINQMMGKMVTGNSGVMNQNNGGVMNQNNGGVMNQNNDQGLMNGASWEQGQDQSQDTQVQNQGQVDNNAVDTVTTVVNDFNKAWLIGYINDKPNLVRTSIVPKDVMEKYWNEHAKAAIKALPNKMLKYIKADGTVDTGKQPVDVSEGKFNAVAFRALFTDEYKRLRNSVGYFQPLQNEAKVRYYVIKYVQDKTENLSALDQARIENDLRKHAVMYNKQKHIAVMTLKSLYKYMGACRTQKMYIAGKSITANSSKVPNEKDSAGTLIVHTYSKSTTNGDTIGVTLLIYYKPEGSTTIEPATTLAQIKTLPHVFLHDIRDNSAKNNDKRPCPLYVAAGEIEEDEVKDGKPTGKKVKKTVEQNVYNTDNFVKIFPEVDLTTLKTAVPQNKDATPAEKRAFRESCLVPYDQISAELARMGIDADDYAKITHPTSKSNGGQKSFDLVAVNKQRNLTMAILNSFASQSSGTWDDIAKPYIKDMKKAL